MNRQSAEERYHHDPLFKATEHELGEREQDAYDNRSRRG
jgi:hypothetical protein